jgi:uncharacterized protein YegL
MGNNDKLTINLQTAAPTRSTLLTGVRRPDFLTSRSAQFVALARDASPSMAGHKADDATRACAELVEELDKPENKDGFTVAVVDFADRADVANPTARAADLNGRIAPIDTGMGSGTNIADALRVCRRLVDQSQRNADRGRLQLRPVVLLFSDGQPNVGGDPRAAADDLKKVADVVTVAFGTDADEQMLRAMATSSQHFYRCRNGRELRAFLASVGKTLTATMSQGRNATVALTQIGQRQ